jgi:hypothetical protein
MVDDQLGAVKKHPQAKLHPTEIVTLGLLFCLKGVHYRAFYRWLKGDWLHLFPNLPEQSRLLRLLAHYEFLTDQFLAEPGNQSVIDSYGIELIHPAREGRSNQQVGKKGKSNYRWIVGLKLCWLITMEGKVIDWGWESANSHDQQFRDIITLWNELTTILSDYGFRKAGEELKNLQFCGHGERNERMVVERVFSMITVVNHFKKIFHRKAKYIQARMGYLAAMFNCLVDMAGGKLAIAQFSL